MALFHSPNITTNGLVLCLDAASKQSYNQAHNLILNSNVLGSSGATLPTNWYIGQLLGGNVSGIGPSNGISKTINGIGYYQFDLIGTANGQGNRLLFDSDFIGVTENTTYTFTYNYNLPVAHLTRGAAIVAQILCFNSSYGYLGGSTQDWQNSSGYNKSSFAFTVPATTTIIRVRFDFVGLSAGNTGEAINITGYLFGGFQLNIGTVVTDYVATTTVQSLRPTTWTDISGKGNNGAIQTGVTYNTLGYFDFNGTNGYVGLANQPTGFAYGAAPGTICAWAKTNTISGSWSWIFSYGSPSSGNSRFIGINGSTYYAGGFGGTGVTGDVTIGGVLLNTWVHVTEVYDGTIAYLYLNGVLAASDAKTWNTTVGIASVGRQVNSNEYWNGSISVMHVYNRALSATEVKQNFNTHRIRYGV